MYLIDEDGHGRACCIQTLQRSRQGVASAVLSVRAVPASEMLFAASKWQTNSIIVAMTLVIVCGHCVCLIDYQ